MFRTWCLLFLVGVFTVEAIESNHSGGVDTKQKEDNTLSQKGPFNSSERLLFLIEEIMKGGTHANLAIQELEKASVEATIAPPRVFYPGLSSELAAKQADLLLQQSESLFSYILKQNIKLPDHVVAVLSKLFLNLLRQRVISLNLYKSEATTQAHNSGFSAIPKSNFIEFFLKNISIIKKYKYYSESSHTIYDIIFNHILKENKESINK